MREGAEDEYEAELGNALERGDAEAATRSVLARHGPEILSFLSVRLGGEEAGREVYALFAEDVWRGVSGYRFRCSLRIWLYILARNAASRYKRAPHRRPERNLPISQHEASAGAHAPRDPTRPYQHTAVKQRVRALRERLSSSDQTLLILHVDRGLSFVDLARVMHDGPGLPEGELLRREAARLRKRFERLKVRLRELAVEEGLLAE